MGSTITMLSEVRSVDAAASRKSTWVKMGGLAVLGVCLVAVALVQNGGVFTSLAGSSSFTQLYDASVYSAKPTLNPTPAPTVNIGGEPVIMAGSYITESTNKTVSKLQLEAKKDMEMVNAITRDIHRNSQHQDDMQAGAGLNAGFDGATNIFYVPKKFDGVQHDLSAYGKLAGGGIHGTPAEIAEIKKSIRG